MHSQADTEQAELERELAELEADDKGEQKELAAIYVCPRAQSVARETGRPAADGP